MGKVIYKGNNCGFLCNKKIEEHQVSNFHTKKQTIVFDNPPSVIGRMSVVGAKEGQGPLGKYFHVVKTDDKNGEKTFEKAEIDMLYEALIGASECLPNKTADLDLIIAGDLLNQITSSSYVCREMNVPYLGIYSACSTMSESLAIASCMLNAGYFNNIACCTASHFATAERQYRYPLEYGCQRPPYAQWTATAAGCSILSADRTAPVVITQATFGKVVDFGVNDLNNMGAAMAPAAMNSMLAMFKDTNTMPKDYDLIITGDLGKLGSDILRDLMSEKGYFLGRNYIDCGSLLYDVTQNCYQGASGAGCSASAVNSYILDKIESGEYQNVAYFATGALMSTQSCYQGETIPCISHGVVFRRR